MTGTQLKEFVDALLEDSMDEDLFLNLVNAAKDKIEGERDWAMLKAFDSSQSATSSAIALPALYSRTIQGMLYVGTIPYFQIPFEQKHLFQNSSNRWYIDFANYEFFLLGTNMAGTINHPYIMTTPEITMSTSPVWPTRFHKLLAYEVAELYYAVDQGDRVRSWDDKWNVQKQLFRLSMIDWDTALQGRAYENAIPPDMETGSELGMY